jgi:IS30 family transposase
MLKEGKSQREIGLALGKNKSSVSRELRRNRNKYGTYQAYSATIQYLHRRKRCRRKARLADDESRKFVCEGLDKYWSPEAISERWKKEHPNVPLCHSTIYRGLKAGLLPGYSRKTHLRRRGKRKNVHNTKVIHPTHTIADRPKETELRNRLGDFEGDTIYGAIGKGCLVTLVDRTSRQLYAVRIPNRDSDIVKEAFATALNGVDVKSITLDNGTDWCYTEKVDRKVENMI